jgi:hypothetical protein
LVATASPAVQPARMKRLAITLLGTLAILSVTGCVEMTFAKYEGQQKAWPTGSSFSDQVYALPVFRGWPEKPYDILGYVEFNNPNVEWNRGDVEQAAKKAKQMGGDAMLMVPKGEASSQKLTEIRQELGIDTSRARGLVLKWK